MIQHGLSKTYSAGCRCEFCVKAHTRRMKQYRVNGPSTMDPAAVKAHLLTLRDAGVTKSQISSAAGVGKATIGRIINDRNSSNRMLKSTARRLLAVKVQDITPEGYFNVIPYQRKLQALVAIGWAKQDLQRMVPTNESNMYDILHGNRKYILADTARKIDALYDRICMQAGTCEQSKESAFRKRWLPPLAWDDIEDLSERPVYRSIVHGSVLRRERVPK